MSSTTPKYVVFARLAEMAQALGHAYRLELLEHLGQGERNVEMLAARTGLTFANTSRHLQHLRRAGLVIARREGKYIFYRLSSESVVRLISTLQRAGQENAAEIERVIASYFRARDALEPVSRETLRDRLRDGIVTLLDVRPEDEFAMGHIPGALNIPLAELERRLSELPATQDIVAYCRGAYCILSFEAVAALRKHGFRARRLEEGYPEWKAAGFPVENALPS